MSVRLSRTPRLLAGFTLLALASGCQDSVAPTPAAGSSPDVPAFLASREGAAGRDLLKDQYIVVFRAGYDDVDARATKLVAKTKGRLKLTFKSGVRGFSAGMTASEAAAMAADPGVAYVEQDQTVTVGVGKSGRATRSKGKTETISPAPGTFVQSPVPSWGIDRLDQATSVFDNKYTYAATGAGVHVYIIDSGIRITHAEFEGRATGDFDLVNDGYGAAGCNWHGTHVAGTVGGVTAGVAKKVSLHSVRILDCNASGSVSGAVAGIDWVIANRVMPAVINLSVAAGSSPVLVDAVERAVASGIAVVAAAGNNAADACGYSPANAPGAITVGSTNTGDQMAEISNQGSCVDLMAPGDAIMSAYSVDDRSLVYASGTSMAAPHVAGAAALYLEANPLAGPGAVTQAILARANSGLIGGLTFGTPNLLLRTF